MGKLQLRSVLFSIWARNLKSSCRTAFSKSALSGGDCTKTSQVPVPNYHPPTLPQMDAIVEAKKTTRGGNAHRCFDNLDYAHRR